MKVSRLKVLLDNASGRIPVGELVLHEKNIHFKYHPDFIRSGINISPFKLALNTEVQTGDLALFGGLFGVFNDSLPDGWGRLLLDRKLAEKGISPYEVGPLDRLAYVGDTGMGALVYEPEISGGAQELEAFNLDVLAKSSQEILQGSSYDLVDDLYALGGSSGGARPKINVEYHPVLNELSFGKKELTEGFEHWLIKFPSQMDLLDVANIEYAYALMAVDCGIEMSAFKLFEGASGKKYFGTKRFDREGNTRIHMHSASGLMHDDFRYSQLDYGHLMDCAFKLEKNVLSYEKILALATFNVFTHNRDDHSKNFAFVMDSAGKWKFAPAYDLTFSNSSHGHHSTTVAGEGLNPTKKHLLELAHIFDVKNPNEIIERVRDVVLNWVDYAKKAEVSAQSMKIIQKQISSHR